MIKILPETIHYEISLWLPYEDKVSFASVNVMLSQHLLKRVRKISLDDEDEENWVNLYLTSDSFREKIDGFIVDPSNQLSLRIVNEESLALEDVNGISCFELKTSVDMLVESFMDHIKKVKSLKLSYDELSIYDEVRLSSFEIIAQWINNNPSLSLNALSIVDNLTDLPVIQSLQTLAINGARSLQIDGLHIPAYSNLRVLRLTNCPSIEDVSCLDQIHELHLTVCEGIYDISCLNNNYKIVITRCENILDYSNCFRHSKIVDISYASESNYDFSKLLEVKEIRIIVNRATIVESFIFPPSPHLRKVHLEGLGCAFTIPSNNHIRVIDIRRCPKFTSFLHFDRIHIVCLHSLQITTLEGLGSGNRVVQVYSCNLIKDFSVLRHCEKVIISECKGFQDTRQLRGVKDFSFLPVEDDKLPKDLEGITCLFLRNIPDVLYSIKYPKSVRRLEIESGSFDHFPSFLASLPDNISSVKVEMSPMEFDLYERWCASMDEENFLPDFIIEFKMKEVYFLRKIR